MTEIESLYRKEEGKILIEIKLSSVVQLFNSFDPAPFHEKELDPQAERYIVDAVDDFPQKTPFKIVIYIPSDLVQTERAKQIIPAVHNHFAYKVLVTDRNFRNRLRYGRSALLIGLSFLFIALVSRQLVSIIDDNIIGVLFADALLIIGWVAMWEPVTIMLYELWSIRQTKKIYERISKMEIEVLPLP